MRKLFYKLAQFGLRSLNTVDFQASIYVAANYLINGGTIYTFVSCKQLRVYCFA
jgi:hypothetical protein